jgi:hypothetical protein
MVEIKELYSLVSRLHGPNPSNGTISEVKATYAATRLPSYNGSMVLVLLGSPLLLGLWTNNVEHFDPRIAKVAPLASELTI